MNTFSVTIEHRAGFTYRIYAEDREAAIDAAMRLAATDLTRSCEDNQYELIFDECHDESEDQKYANASFPVFDAKEVLRTKVAAHNEYEGYSAKLHTLMDRVYGQGDFITTGEDE